MTVQNGSASTGPVRLGLCGIGRTGFGRIRREITEQGQFVMRVGFDLIPERVQRFCETFDARPAGTFEAMIRDPEVEAVVIATRSDTHAELAMAALRAGKHVVVEKPMACNLAQADEVIAVARESVGSLFVRHNRRFDPGYQLLRELVAGERVGPLHSVQLRVGEFVRRDDWQTLKKFGGGQLLNWGPHAIDWALHLIGGRAVSQWSDLKLVVAAGDAEDHVKLLLRGPTGIVADLEISGANAARQPMIVAQGSRGALVLGADHSVMVRQLRSAVAREQLVASSETPQQDDKRYKAEGQNEWIEEVIAPAARHQGDFWAALFQTLRENRPFPVTLDESREVMRIIETARQGSGF